LGLWLKAKRIFEGKLFQRIRLLQSIRFKIEPFVVEQGLAGIYPGTNRSFVRPKPVRLPERFVVQKGSKMYGRCLALDFLAIRGT
jgi:hypothetical protein